MDMDSTGGSSCWLYDYGYDISVPAPDFMPSDHSPASVFTWNMPQTHIIKPPSSNIRWLNSSSPFFFAIS
jgi:hypothetical protein